MGCSYATDDQPCWGQIKVDLEYDGDGNDLHACEGHRDVSWDGTYKAQK